ncbi:lipase family protein [Streptomyces xiamenensis]
MTATTPFDHDTRAYSVPHAYALAHASALAYQEEPVIEETTANWGFDRVRHHETRFTPPFPLQDTQAFTAAGDRMIVTAFRGTEPARIQDWLTDATTPPRPGYDGRGYVHYGFGEALDSIWPDVRDTVAAFRDNGQSLWFTGHSLGGALAMLADGVYTYGQPRTCDRLLADAFDQGFGDRAFRCVNNNDIVPQLPPEPAYTHVRALRYLDSEGRLHDSMPLLPNLADRARGLTADALAPASDALRDHPVQRYLEALEKNLT